MAILAELAYLPFDEESKQQILDLAAELAKLTNLEKIVERLTTLQKVLAGLSPPPLAEEDSNKVLKAALAAGDFELADGRILHDVAIDTQAFVACRRDATGTGMAVICFRGTKQIKDWMTNAKIKAVPVREPNGDGIIGNMHEGFHTAHMSVHKEIGERLKGSRICRCISRATRWAGLLPSLLPGTRVRRGWPHATPLVPPGWATTV